MRQSRAWCLTFDLYHLCWHITCLVNTYICCRFLGGMGQRKSDAPNATTSISTEQLKFQKSRFLTTLVLGKNRWVVISTIVIDLFFFCIFDRGKLGYLIGPVPCYNKSESLIVRVRYMILCERHAIDKKKSNRAIEQSNILEWFTQNSNSRKAYELNYSDWVRCLLCVMLYVNDILYFHKENVEK